MGRGSAVAQVAKPAPERNAAGKRAGLATCATSGNDSVISIHKWYKINF
jgi:hypothetical protein